MCPEDPNGRRIDRSGTCSSRSDMVLDKVWQICTEELFPQSGDLLFNPYLDEDPARDLPRAPAIRRANLRRYLEAYEELPAVLLIAEAPGPWGCRFSGVPITSEAQLVDDDFPLTGAQSSAREAPYSEYSAGIFWRLMSPYFPRFLVWNAVPFHPYRPGEPASIRTPRAAEVRRFEAVTALLVEAVAPACIGAIGRKAERQLQDLGLACTYLRHPSQGGASLFAAGVQRLFASLGFETTS